MAHTTDQNPYGPLRTARTSANFIGTLAVALGSPPRHGSTRVMSPNRTGAEQGCSSDLDRAAETSSVASGPQWGVQLSHQHENPHLCNVCSLPAHELWLCSGCSAQGHQQCLATEVVERHAFCAKCLPWAHQQHQAFLTAAQKQRWIDRLSAQFAVWRSVTITATGAMASAGLAVGSATAAVAVGAGALALGAIEGAQRTANVISPQRMLPPSNSQDVFEDVDPSPRRPPYLPPPH